VTDYLAISFSYVVAVILGIGLRLRFPFTYKNRQQMLDVLFGMLAGTAFLFLVCIVLLTPLGG